MMKTILLTILVLTAIPATAKPWAQKPEPEAELGAAVRANIAAQTVNADPDYTNAPPMTTSAKRTSDALVRYELGLIKPLLQATGSNAVGSQGGATDKPTIQTPLISSSAPKN